MVFLTILMDFIVFIPIYLSESLNLDPATASMTGSTFPAGMFLALIVTGIFYDRISKPQLVKLLGGSMAISCLCAATLWALPSLPISSAMQTPLALIAIFLFGFTISPAYYIPMSLFSIAYGGKHSGFLIAFIDVCGYSGALLFNFFGGSIAQTYGWSVFLAGLISIAVLALVTMTWFLHLNANAEQQPA